MNLENQKTFNILIFKEEEFTYGKKKGLPPHSKILGRLKDLTEEKLMQEDLSLENLKYLYEMYKVKNIFENFENSIIVKSPKYN